MILREIFLKSSELGFYKTFIFFMTDDINFLSAFFFNSAMFLFVAQGFGFLIYAILFLNENKKAYYIFAWLGAICFMKIFYQQFFMQWSV